LNSSRAAPKVGISVPLQQAAGNSNLNVIILHFTFYLLQSRYY
jgi:hypothetical protein